LQSQQYSRLGSDASTKGRLGRPADRLIVDTGSSGYLHQSAARPADGRSRLRISRLRLSIAARASGAQRRDMSTMLVPCLACLISLAMLFSFFDRQGTCLQCGGQGGHRRDCPHGEDEG
jgi:hypothetical protein